MIYFVYILECSDKSLYTGVTNDLKRRVLEHNTSIKAAKYTRARRPVKLVYFEEKENLSQACKREVGIKKLKRLEKLTLINHGI